MFFIRGGADKKRRAQAVIIQVEVRKLEEVVV